MTVSLFLMSQTLPYIWETLASCSRQRYVDGLDVRSHAGPLTDVCYDMYESESCCHADDGNDDGSYCLESDGR